MIPRAFPFLSLHILSCKAIIINAVSYWHIAKTQTCLYEHFIFVLLERLWKHFPLRGYTCSNENQNEWESLGYFKRKLLFWLNYFLLFRQNIRNVSNIKLFVAHSTGKERNLNHIADLASLIQIISKNYTILRRPWNFFSFEENLRRLLYSSM